VRPPIGSLRDRLRLEAPLDADDGAGGTTRTWQTVATVWGRIVPIGAGERVAADRLEAHADHRVTIRWRADVTARMRFVAGTRVLEIRGLSDIDERHRHLDCLCEEIPS
jgi:SPP1 family predicted phage head-tail adaptor